jgi:hypothetical protein
MQLITNHIIYQNNIKNLNFGNYFSVDQYLIGNDKRSYQRILKRKLEKKVFLNLFNTKTLFKTI